MAHFLLVVLTTVELLDSYLFTTAMANNSSHNFTACYQRGTHLDVFTISDQQNLIELDSLTSGNFNFFQTNSMAFSNTVLLTTTLKNSVHSYFTPKFLTRRLISMRLGATKTLMTMGAEFTRRILYWQALIDEEEKKTGLTRTLISLLLSCSLILGKLRSIKIFKLIGSCRFGVPSYLESTMDLTAIRQLADADMQAVNQLIYKQLESDVALINQLGFYIINGGGKRMRPLLSILAARSLDYSGEAHLKLAAIIEFIHTASLLHDDVVDESTLRRGRETANALFGNSASVLVGDFLYTRSFQMMTELESMKVLQVLANTTNVLAEGEVLQLMNCNDPDTTEASYMRVIYCKTAKLFEAATRLAGVLAGCDSEMETALANYGKYLGTAFQLTDDLLDYTADAEELGKNIGDDLAEGKPTLPLIYAIAHGTEPQRQMIRQAIEQGDGTEHIEAIIDALNTCGALEYTQQRAYEESDKAIEALSVLPESDYKQALISLAKIAVARSH